MKNKGFFPAGTQICTGALILACPGLFWTEVIALKVVPGISVKLILFLELQRATGSAQVSSGRTLMPACPGPKITFVLNLASKSHPRRRWGLGHIKKAVSQVHFPHFTVPSLEEWLLLGFS